MARLVQIRRQTEKTDQNEGHPSIPLEKPKEVFEFSPTEELDYSENKYYEFYIQAPNGEAILYKVYYERKEVKINFSSLFII